MTLKYNPIKKKIPYYKNDIFIFDLLQIYFVLFSVFYDLMIIDDEQIFLNLIIKFKIS